MKAKELQLQDELRETNLEKIIFEVEDKSRIFPIIKRSPQVTHIKIYWTEKKTLHMSIIFDIIMNSKSVRIIEFVHRGNVFKPEVMPFESGFNFAYNGRNFEISLDKRCGKIICRKIYV